MSTGQSILWGFAAIWGIIAGRSVRVFLSYSRWRAERERARRLAPAFREPKSKRPDELLGGRSK